jgi:hypothetical protein
LFAKLDTLVDGAVFMPLYNRYANASGFPEYRPALERLGIAVSDERVSLHGDAELSGIRESITARRNL